MKKKVLIVDDSALIRQMLTEMLNADPELEVVGTAQDPYAAREKIKTLNPDVLTLDVEMPRMDGVTFLGNLMRLRPMPVVMVSSLTERGADVTLQALELGAVDFVSKPRIDVAHTLNDYAEEIIGKVKAAAQAHVRALVRPADISAPRPADDGTRPRKLNTTDKILAIGASTGGTEAIKVILSRLPADAPGTVITQHLPAPFSEPFAKRMNGVSAMNVCVAQDGQHIVPGHAYIAPGGLHLRVERDGARYVCRLDDGPPVNRHRPSVDVMFRSVAQNVGANAVSVLLTGMGKDGARGMLEMHEAGAPTLAQDEKSSIVWGMPGEAVKLGGVDEVVSLNKMADRVLDLFQI